MSAEHPESFVDNWAYLKTELNWLERLLMLAVARQRKDTKETDRLAQSRADKATSHWWKGVIALDAAVAYDEHRTPPATGAKSYQQQLDDRIKLSQQKGVVLVLPTLRDRLNLSWFEKNLLLMAVAPEVNRRYSKLYRYLQGDDPRLGELPTVDLVLRLMCRNDVEWRTARACLMPTSPLMQFGLIKLVPQPLGTFLSQTVQLNENLVNCILHETPSTQEIEALLIPSAVPRRRFLTVEINPVAWETVVVPDADRDRLIQLVHVVQLQPQINQQWGAISETPGRSIVLSGARGTGKTTIARAIAHQFGAPLTRVDLSCISPYDYELVLQDIAAQAPPVLLIEAADCWLRRTSPLPADQLQQFFAQRHRQRTITVLSVVLPQTVHIAWQRHFSLVQHLPMPNATDRLKLWQAIFPANLSIDSNLEWKHLAQKLTLSGGEIQAIAMTALALLTAAQQDRLTADVLQKALAHHGHAISFALKKTRSRSAKSRQRAQE